MKKLKVILVYFLDYLFREKGLAQKTLSSNRYSLIKYNDFLKENEVYSFERINKELINNYPAYLKREGLNTESIYRNIFPIRAFYRFMLFEGYINRDIASLIELPQIGRKFPYHDVLSLEEINRLFDNSNFRGYLGQRDQAILELLYDPGIRTSELINLGTDDIDLENRQLKCLGKGSRERIIPFGSKTYQLLSLYIRKIRPRLIKDPGESTLFLGSKKGGSLTKRLIDYLMNRYGQKAGIKKRVNSFILRRTFATHLLKNGIDLKSIQAMLGHPNIYYTQGYLNINRHQVKTKKKVKKEDKLKFSETYKNTRIRLFCKDCINFKECKGKKWEECEYRDELLKVV